MLTAQKNISPLRKVGGLLEEGLADILHSISLDNQNSYAYRNQDLYYLTKNDPVRALQLSEQARQMGESTDMIKELVKQAAIDKEKMVVP